jgi:hypothetical protein
MTDVFGAGILFISYTVGSVLAGFHPKLDRWSGFGGKCHENEIYIDTAVREVVEEIFGIFSLSPDVLSELGKCVSSAPRNDGGYMLFIEPIDTLLNMCEVLRKNAQISPYYQSIPSHVDGIIVKRYVNSTSEINKLLMFAIRDIQDIRYLFTDEFYQDIQSLYNSYGVSEAPFPKEYMNDINGFANFFKDMGADDI